MVKIPNPAQKDPEITRACLRDATVPDDANSKHMPCTVNFRAKIDRPI